MMGDWTFFSNYGHVLVCLARNREARLRDVARDVGITERAVQKIVRDLQDAGFLTVTKQGRCNRYRINRRRSLRHSLESHCSIGKLLALVAKPEKSVSAAPEAAKKPEHPRPTSPAEPPSDPAPPVLPAVKRQVTEERVAEERVAKERAEEEEEQDTQDAARRAEAEDAGKKERKSASVDTRQQGSLF